MPSSIPPAEPWTADAACKRQTALFFPESEGDAHDVAQAKAVCRGCPVREECLEAGLSEPHGIWGGLTVAERRKLRHRKHRAAA